MGAGKLLYEDVGGSGIGRLGDLYTIEDLIHMFEEAANDDNNIVSRYPNFDEWFEAARAEGYFKIRYR